MKRQRTTSCSASLEWLENDGYKPVKQEIRNVESRKVETICLGTSDSDDIFGNDLAQDELDTVSMMLLIKDCFDVSGLAYHEMAKVCKMMPRHFKLKNKIVELNKLWNIRPLLTGRTKSSSLYKKGLKLDWTD